EEKIKSSRNFANKLWNATRFILMNYENEDANLQVKLEDLTAADKWILSKVNDLAVEVTDNMDKYDLGIAVQKLYDFAWEEFCDWYIEMVKPRLYNQEDPTRHAALWTLKTVMINVLKMLHPYMPFITEEIFMGLQDQEESIMISSWPVYQEAWHFETEEQEISLIKEAVRSIRNVRSEMNVPPSRKAQVFVVSEDATVQDIFARGKVFFATLASASEVIIQGDKAGIDEDAVSTIIPKASLFIPLAELVDFEKEIERLTKEKAKLQGEVDRVVKKLSNQGFVAKAPEKLIEEEKAKQAKYEAMLAEVAARLEKFNK
ncbi:MAG: class I tRNA ligase family protein, partial [Niameybacter sp.]